MSSPDFDHFRFMDLPGELRDQIWDHTLEPRRITLTCKTVSSMSRYKPVPRPFAFFPPPRSPDHPTQHFAWLTSETTAPMALQICRESRGYAKRSYKSWPIWKQMASVMYFRNLVWDPAVDVVVFSNMSDCPLPIERFLPLFVKQFPGQATQIQRIMIQSSIWRDLNHDVVARIWSLIECPQLKELIIELDEVYEMQVIEWCKFLSNHQMKPWKLPNDIESQIKNLDAHYTKLQLSSYKPGWKPVVRVVREGNDIFDADKDSEIVLRKFPCPDLDIANT